MCGAAARSDAAAREPPRAAADRTASLDGSSSKTLSAPGATLGLPALAIAWQMTPRAFGVFAGLTVYAAPQVLAATAPISSLSAQIGTLVKLIRVLMLGPVVLALSLLSGRDRAAPSQRQRSARPPLRHLAPWFIIGFLLLVAARSAGLIPEILADPVSRIASGLTIVSMAALGLGVDVRTVARAGLRVSLVVTLSLLALGGAALLTIRALGLG
jgi:uncharacterized membrane protein YadS